MSSTAQILDEVLALPITDRSFLVSKLIESLDAPEPLSDEEAATLRRRSAELHSGKVAGISLETLTERVAARRA